MDSQSSGRSALGSAARPSSFVKISTAFDADEPSTEVDTWVIEGWGETLPVVRGGPRAHRLTCFLLLSTMHDCCWQLGTPQSRPLAALTTILLISTLVTARPQPEQAVQASMRIVRHPRPPADAPGLLPAANPRALKGRAPLNARQPPGAAYPPAPAAAPAAKASERGPPARRPWQQPPVKRKVRAQGAYDGLPCYEMCFSIICALVEAGACQDCC